MMSERSLAFEKVNSSNKSAFQKLCTIIFPVQYAPGFFKSLISGKMDSGDDCIGYLAILEGRPIGLVSWSTSDSRTHLLNLGVLIHHRRSGIGSQLFELVPKDPPLISLYVQSSNDDALSFYVGKGFKKVRLEKGYYSQRLDCSDAYFIEKYLS
eukprot:TRINITY_DN5597_c0_g1_i1.p1 TRINITY_DN5597_c0_g1~~TRINITY_DN5597_c0_g1_i1.p1  ORF type:complete len:154 (-),score=32.83 TRINITY_DN5597_c0_g1_i1:57-518(-)